MDEQDRYARAKSRVDEIRGFYMHLAAYIVVNLLLFGINMVTSPGTLWFFWVTIFWGGWSDLPRARSLYRGSGPGQRLGGAKDPGDHGARRAPVTRVPPACPS